MAQSANLGFPRIGTNRELKKLVESYWKGNKTLNELESGAQELRLKHWKMQANAGLDFIPSNDFSFYDQMLDMICTLGAIPTRYESDSSSIDTYFAMARGRQIDGIDVKAMEMTKYFDTNYHYIVPEFSEDMQFSLNADKIINEYKEAKEAGIETRPVIIGAATFINLGKGEASRSDLLAKILPIYKELLQKLADIGVKWVQIDEPSLVLDLPECSADYLPKIYNELAEITGIKIMLTTYFGDLRENLDIVAKLPVAGVHVDLVRGAGQLNDVLAKIPADKILSLGIIDGRNIWKNNLTKSLKLLEQVNNREIIVAPSCSLLHSPVDLDSEIILDAEIKDWMAFAKQKLTEISELSNALNGNKNIEYFIANAASISNREQSSRIHNAFVKERAADRDEKLSQRNSPYIERAKLQRPILELPLLPTTTIGSFPQTGDVRKNRAAFKKNAISRADYDIFLEKETKNCIKIQEDIGLDVLVHGEFERNDMVEYFGEKLEGFAFTKFGWVQSYGTRCVKPPVIFGDISRPKAMTVHWAVFAQNQTNKLMKGMLTGPVTILQWSFVRDDQAESETCRQIAFAIRDEVADLEEAGIKIIQIDEAALREGLPLRKSDWQNYLNWAVESFRISASIAKDTTQIHTHMCYSEFNDIMGSIADMDADVISVETSRSDMELLEAFADFKYPNEIGPGVYDIHSPRVPLESEITDLLTKALKVLNPEQLWVNPDCGLKTRGWKEVKPALITMVNAAKKLRMNLKENKKAS